MRPAGCLKTSGCLFAVVLVACLLLSAVETGSGPDVLGAVIVTGFVAFALFSFFVKYWR